MQRFLPLVLGLSLAVPGRAVELPLAAQHELGDEHHYLQAAGGAAAVSLTGKPAGRLIVAFPAGNSGVGLWLTEAMPPGAWRLAGEPVLEPVGRDGRHGVRGVIATTRARLAFRAPLGGTLRFLRGYDREGVDEVRDAMREVAGGLEKLSPAERARVAAAGLTPERVAAWTTPSVEAGPRRLKLAWSALAGGVSTRLELAVEAGGAIERAADGRVVVTPGPAGRVQFHADTGYAPLTPWPVERVYAPEALERVAAMERADPVRGRMVREGLGRLRFLVYREKLLAGSWRYLTYFGRDTLLTVRMLRGMLTPEVIEGALGSVLARVSVEGRVAHEEDLGDQAALDRARELLRGRVVSAGALDQPVYDYKMVDGDFLLPIALAEYAGDPRIGSSRAKAFLDGEGRRAQVLANMERVLSQAARYGLTRAPRDLVSLLEGSDVGDWRDSLDGLARGRYAFSLNAVLVPQALGAVQALLEARVLGEDVMRPPYVHVRLALRHRGYLEGLREAWGTSRAPFVVRRDAKFVAAAIQAYLRDGPLEPGERELFGAVSSDPSAQEFPAVSLDRDGNAIPVMCSDDVLALFGPALAPEDAVRRVRPLVTPFPAGLLTPAGLLVANPALSGSRDLWGRFSRRGYHGTVVWAWPMAMAELGIRRQLQAMEAGKPREELEAAREKLAALRRKLEVRGLGELWSFKREGRDIVPVGFGASAADTTESNSLQLWSASWLALALGDGAR